MVGDTPTGALMCDHADRGCPGQFEVVYVGPKGGMPSEYHQPCRCPPLAQLCGACPSAPVLEAPSRDAQKLMDMGFLREPAETALTKGKGNLEAALDWLTSQEGAECTQRAEADASAARPCGQPAALQALSGAAVCSAASSSDGAMMPVEELDCCPICTEDMNPNDAAMRCNGAAGRRHYFHVQCLTQWIQQCRRDGHAPTCPTCRGALQVQQKRLHDFLSGKGQKLDESDREVIDAMQDSAEPSGPDGWNDVRTDTLLTGALVVAGAAIAGMALASALSAFAGERASRRRRGSE